jgi:shikimate dehydrogenase
MPQITGTTKILGVIGNPIAHSLSPVIHNAAIESLGLDYRYVAFPVRPEQLPVALTGFAAIGVSGCSVTIPHKQAIMPLLTSITPLAQAVGAVNTIWHNDTGWHGTNTDVAGFISPLIAIDQDWAQMTVVILGNGGAARAVIAGCHQLGCGEIHVFGRDQSKLAAFAASWQDIKIIKLTIGDRETPAPVKLQTHFWSELPTLVARANLLLVNCTPIGMHPQVDTSPIDVEIMTQVGSNSIAYDLIYTPRPTKFLQLAKNLGLRTIDGVEMLIHQGAIAFELWLQQPAAIDIMRQALLQQLNSKV